jgi:hypothetical protein
MIANEGRINIPTITIGALLAASGFVINYLLERHNIFKVLGNSAYPISWADLFYPPFCVLLCLAGTVFIVGSALHRANARALLRYTAAIAIPLTILYTLLAFAMQFIQTGADRLGECPGLDEAAAASSVIPESKWRPGYPAVGCAVERRGIFLAYYNDITVYGVTDPVPQAIVLGKLREHYRQLHTHPVQVRFFQQENWSVRKGKNGTTFGSRGPEHPIRVANIG